MSYVVGYPLRKLGISKDLSFILREITGKSWNRDFGGEKSKTWALISYGKGNGRTNAGKKKQCRIRSFIYVSSREP